MTKETLDLEPSDDELVARHRADPSGESGRRALAELVGRWRERVYVWALRVLRERESALDAAQDSIVLMIQALPRYQPRGHFGAWVFVIVHNHCLSEIRRRRVRYDDDVDFDELEDHGRGIEEMFEQAQQAERVLERVRDVLEPTERAALWLRAHEGMSVNDIAKLLQIDSASGARGLLQTARRKLRASLARDEKGSS